MSNVQTVKLADAFRAKGLHLAKGSPGGPLQSDGLTDGSRPLAAIRQAAPSDEEAGALPPLGNTGGNSPSTPLAGAKTGILSDPQTPQQTTNKPATIALGWVKIKHTPKSWEVWSAYRAGLGLGEGAEQVNAGRQHRVFGAKYPWGGCDYWGWPLDKAAGQDLGEWAEYGLTLPVEQLAATGGRCVQGESVLTEWSDDALVMLAAILAEQSWGSVLSLLADLLAAGAVVTRLDISGDFADTTIDAVEAARLERDYLPMRVSQLIDSRDKPMGGRTCYFGTRGADGGGVFVRFYEKGREMGLPVDLLRYEVELTGEKAQDAAKRLAASEDAWWPIGASILAGAMDFRDGYGAKRGNPHAARDCERHKWWASLLERLNAAVKLKGRKRIPATLGSLRDWLEASAPRALAIMRAWYGEERYRAWMVELLGRGADAMTEADRAMIRAAAAVDVPF